MRPSFSAARSAVIAVLSCLAVLAIPILSSTPVAAPSVGTLSIIGYVTDNAGHTMEGIQVWVTSLDGETIAKTLMTTTDQFGFYSVVFSGFGSEWGVGYTIVSTAKSGGNEVSENATVPDDITPLIQIDLQFAFEIPQFGNLLGFVAAAAIIGVVAVFFLVPRRDKTIKQ